MSESSIATLKEIAVFWTEILRDEDSDLKDKLKVTELLSKYSGEIISEKDREELTLEEMYGYIQKIRETTESDI